MTMAAANRTPVGDADFLRAVLDAVVDAVLAIDDRGIIHSGNSAAARMFGYRPAELIGKNVRILMPEPHASGHDEYIRNYVKTGTAKVIGIGREVAGRRKDGSVFLIDININEMCDGTRRMFVGTIRDVTAQKEVERLKGEFISGVSHELRTPLTSIQGSLGLLKALANDLPVNAVRLLDLADRNCERLIALVNDILDIEQIASGNMRLDIRRESLAALLRLVIDANLGFAEQLEVSITLAPVAQDWTIEVDSARLSQVLSNLLSNAAKFSPAGSTVEVFAERRDDMIRICVKDHGPGLPPEFRSAVFERFSQAGCSIARMQNGSGLGLHISKELVERMGGRIGFESEAGQGATFWIDVPAAPQVELAQSLEPSRARKPHRRVLVCEDDQDIGFLIQTILRDSGFAADLARTLPEARQKVRVEHYDAITLDVGMPPDDGIAFAREMAAGPQQSRLPIIVVSGKPAGRRLASTDGTDIVDWIVKPFDEAHLAHAVAKAIGTIAEPGLRPHVD
jgi:PAS domain S-box-containing protein